jgi:hypothetical protein
LIPLSLILVVACKTPKTVTETDESTEEKGEELLEEPMNKREYTLPKIIALNIEDGEVFLRLRLNGKCEKHELKWVKKDDCLFEIQDHTMDDKCMGYQFVEEKYTINKDCKEVVVNGLTYP